MQQAITEQQSLKQIWYGKAFVLLEICKLAKNRELSFLPTDDSPNRVRCVNCSFVDILKKNFEGFHFMQRNFNLYYSLAHLKNMPMFSFAPETRKLQQADFTRNFNNYFVGYDLGIDFDGNMDDNKHLIYYNGEKTKIDRTHYGRKDNGNRGIDSYDLIVDGKIVNVKPSEIEEMPIEEQVARARNDLILLSKELNNYKIEYSAKFSGKRGFHANIDDKNFPDVEPTKKVEIALKLEKELAKILNLKTINYGLSDNRRIWKCSYSLIGDNVALPLDDFQIKYFKLENMKALNVLNDIKIMNRGILERNAELPLEDKKANFKRMLEDYEVI